LRVCKTCGIEKPHSEFKKQVKCIDGIRPHCKSCDKIKYLPSLLASKDKYYAARKLVNDTEEQKRIISEKGKAYHSENKEHRNKKCREYHHAHKEELAVKAKVRIDRRRGTVDFQISSNTFAANYRAKKLKATVPWADKEAIKTIYAKAKRLQQRC